MKIVLMKGGEVVFEFDVGEGAVLTLKVDEKKEEVVPEPETVVVPDATPEMVVPLATEVPAEPAAEPETAVPPATEVPAEAPVEGEGKKTE